MILCDFFFISLKLVKVKYFFVSAYFQNSILAVAGDDEFVRLCHLGDGNCLCVFKAHETR